MTLQISITGEPGCGKTTVATLVAQDLGAGYLSTGSIQRELAARMGVSTLELNRIAEKDRSIDEQIDAHTKALGGSRQLVVVDSRLAWRFLPASLKVFLVCPPSVAASRVYTQKRAEENYESREHAAESLVLRHESERARFAEYYGASLGNLRNYDLVIDTSIASPGAIAEAVGRIAKTRRDLTSLPRVLISPASLFPTQDVGGVAEPYLAPVRSHFGDDRIRSGDMGLLEVCRVSGAWAVVDGHKRTALGLGLHAEFLHASLRGLDDEVLRPGVTARSLLESEVTWSRIHDWEAAFDFTFVSYPPFLPGKAP